MKTKKPALNVLKKKAWKAFSDYIRERDHWTCITCGQKGSGSGIHAGHFIPKHLGGVLLRFHPENVHAQCYRCNRHMDGYGAMYSIKIREKYGPTHDLNLMAMIKPGVVWKPSQYGFIIEMYNEELKKLQEKKKLENKTIFSVA